MAPNLGGSVTISAISVLENRRNAEPSNKLNTLSLLFDAHLYLGDSQGLASLRFFNADNLTFEDVEPCFIIANIARTPSDVKGIASTGVSTDDYDLVGDIIQLIPIGMDTNTNLRNRPFITISGSVDRVDDNTFSLSPEQYIASCKDLSSKPSMPAKCWVPETPRWKNRAPKVKAGTYISVGGFMSGIERDDKQCITNFLIEVEKVTFLGRAPVAPRAVEGSLETPIKQNGKGLKFDYNSPSPLPGKRRRLEAESSSSSLSVVSEPSQ
ncbi:hypothetical protein H0H93_006032 [Arthromyces matolae]|nr:hypothetical protein H0H93_006032 [Arthromyces matolae]